MQNRLWYRTYFLLDGTLLTTDERLLVKTLDDAGVDERELAGIDETLLLLPEILPTPAFAITIAGTSLARSVPS